MKMSIWILTGALCLSTWSARGAEWLTDLKAAKAAAKEQNKVIVMDFTGSDWCPFCKNLKAKVLDTPEFEKLAREKLVLLEVDFPRKNPLSKKQQKANDKLFDKYGIQMYPTLLITDERGKKLGMIEGYEDESVGTYLGKIEAITAKAKKK
jgi:thioredoxin-related protein